MERWKARVIFKILKNDENPRINFRCLVEAAVTEEEKLDLLMDIFNKTKILSSAEDKESVCAGPISQLVANIAEILKLKDPENFFEHIDEYE